MAAKFSRSGVVYGILSTVFDREFRAVHAGLRRYHTELSQNGTSQAALRRNIHRLEKGLLMRPRRPIFATDYVLETVRCFRARIETGAAPAGNSEIQWCADVLRDYFAAVGDHPKIDEARNVFGDITLSLPKHDGRVPYRRVIPLQPTVSFEALLALSKQRRSVRWFQDKPVPRELVKKAMEVALEAPSACNRQPFVFRAFDDPKLVSRVASIPMGTAGYSQSIPAIIVVVGQLRNFFSERDRHLIYVDGALAAMGFAFALETLGLSSCFINWPDMESTEVQMRELLKLDSDERPVFLIALGYPDPAGLVANSTKKGVADVLRFSNYEH